MQIIDKITKELLFDLYINQNKTSKEIANLFNKKEPFIKSRLRKYKIIKPESLKHNKIPVNKLTTQDFIQKAITLYGNLYDYSQVDYKTAYTKVKIFCNKCKCFFYQTPHCHLTGRGCSICGRKRAAGKLRLSFDEFVKRANKIHKNRYLYEKPTTDIFVTSSYITIKCKKCNQTFKQWVNNHLRGIGCPYCKMSKGEIAVAKWLTENKVSFISQYRFKDCKDKKSLPFDFYLLDYNTCVEFQGAQHYDENYYKWKIDPTRNFETQQLHDKIKKEYCKKNKIMLLEIKYNESIEEKLENFFRNFKK